MLRCLGPLVLASSMTGIVAPVWAAPPLEGPVEGPAPPPSEPSEQPSEPSEVPPPSIEPGAIEFAVPEPGAPPPPTAAPPLTRREEIGDAPASGGAFIAGGAWLLPLAGFGTWALIVVNQRNEYPPYPSQPGIIVAGAGLGVIGMAMLGTGIHRSVKLQRWATRHRVIALPQGSGLVTSGTLAGLVGLMLAVTAGYGGDEILGGIAAAVLVTSPIQLAVGIRFSRRYKRTGGWRATRYTLTPLGVQVRF